MAGLRGEKVDQVWTEGLQRLESSTWRVARQLQREQFFEGGVVMDLLDSLPGNACLFIANSLSVRHLDQFGEPRPKTVDIYCNRGASGIDGTVASAAGVAALNPDRGVVLLMGDLALLHDLNSLLLVKTYAPNLKIVVINNNGGGIFQRLPVSAFEPYFTPLFITPHGLGFEFAARMFGLAYCSVSDWGELHPVLKNGSGNDGPQLVEVRGDALRHESARRDFLAQLNSSTNGETK